MGKFIFAMGLVFLGYSAMAEEAVKVKLFSATWCAPCVNLDKELKVKAPYGEYNIEQNGKKLTVKIEEIVFGEKDMQDYAVKVGKKTEVFPEQQIFIDGKLVAIDNWSDFHSLDIFVKRVLTKQGVFLQQ